MRSALNHLQNCVRAARLRLLKTSNHAMWSPSSVRVDYVDDPVRPIRLVRVEGRIGLESIDSLVRSWDQVSAPHLVHLDVRDAQIADCATMRRLEAALDHLELQRIDVRIVGLDPYHPALAS